MKVQAPGQCAFEHCERRAASKGLCEGHYAQQRRGKPLTYMPNYPPPCPEWKPQETFNRLWLTALPGVVE